MASNYSYPDFVNQLKTLHLKKKGKKPKVSPNKFYPYSAESQTTELLRGELDDYAAKLSRAALEGGVEAIYAVLGAPPDSFREEVERISREIDNFQVKAFANFSEMVVGERYFPSSDEKEVILRTWQENFVNLCKSTNEEMRKRSAGIISDGVLNGRNMKELVKELQNNCGDFSRSKAELIATTEVGKLNTAMNRAQSQSAGIDYYEWAAAMDGRTRESHALMDGKICAWGKDDVYYEWEDVKKNNRLTKALKEHKRTDKMYHGAPGTDFRCRCVALPYVPEFEDDYEEERNEGPVQGIVLGKNADRKTEEELYKILGKIQRTKMQRQQDKNLRLARKLDRDAKFENQDLFVLSDSRRLSKSKEKGESEKFSREKEMALHAVLNGHPIIFLNEYNYSKPGTSNPDAVMDGKMFEFKKMKPKQIERRLIEGLEQAPNIYMRLDGEMSFNDFITEIIKDKKNILNLSVEKSKYPKKTLRAKENVKKAELYVSIGDDFRTYNLSKL